MNDNNYKLTSLIDLAVKNGFSWKYDSLPIYRQAQRKLYVVDRDGCNYPLNLDDSELYKLLFSYGFAKAIWGEEKYKAKSIIHDGVVLMTYPIGELYVWQYHLQQAVVSKDPLQYFLDNLKR